MIIFSVLNKAKDRQINLKARDELWFLTRLRTVQSVRKDENQSFLRQPGLLTRATSRSPFRTRTSKSFEPPKSIPVTEEI
jgi:hypothetical protein